jgi:hypothetical protein
VSRRPLVIVPALTLLDLLLWHWSLAAHHEVLALASGLSLPPMIVASLWLVALAAVRLLARGVLTPLTVLSRGRAGRAGTRATVATGKTASTASRTGISSPSPRATPLPATPRVTAARSTAPRPAQVPLAAADREGPPRKIAA